MNVIKLIGRKRALVLGVAAAVNVAIGAVWLAAVQPLTSEIGHRQAAVNGAISQLMVDTGNIKAELKAFPENYKKYQEMQRRGFFLDQDRFVAGKLLDDMKEGMGLLEYSYRMEELQVKKSPLAAAAGGELLDSAIKVESVSSLLDGEVYGLLRRFGTAFPAQTRLVRFSISRNGEVGMEELKAIAEGNPPPLVTASFELQWITMVPREEEEGQAGGGFRGR